MFPSAQQADLQAAAQAMSWAELAYPNKSEAYVACGHAFPEVPDTGSSIRVDPTTEAVNVSIAMAQNTPTFSWGKPGQLYTVIAWDAGSTFLHAIYINAEQNMASGQPVKAYGGPQNNRPFGNTYVFVAIPQPNNQRLDFAAVTGTLYAIISQGTFGTFNFESFFNTYFTMDLLSSAHISLLNIPGDALGAKLAERRGETADFCPLYASRSYYLQRALSWSMLLGQTEWAGKAGAFYALTNFSPTAYMTSLNVSVGVTWRADDTEFESCCSNHKFLRSQLTADSFMSPSRAERPVQLRNKPDVELKPMKGQKDRFTFESSKMYTLMLVDFGNDFMNKSATPPPEPTFVVHWMVADITGSKVEQGNEIIPYFGSNPFSKNSPRMYTFLLMQQDAPFDTSNLQQYVQGTCRDYPQRCFWKVPSMVMGLGLGPLRGVQWYFAEQDAFARRRMYKDWAYVDASRACGMEKGFAEPCPAKTDCQDDEGESEEESETAVSARSPLFQALSVVGNLVLGLLERLLPFFVSRDGAVAQTVAQMSR